MNWKYFAAAVLIACLSSPAFADKRVALVIGNSAYQNVSPLPNPKSDATLMAATLGRLGFVLVGGGAQIDLDKARFDAAVQNFGNQLIGADVALFYYAGHGIQVRGTNYLVPITANPVRETDVDFQMIDVSLVLRQMEGAGTKLNLVILDACRNNPFGGRGLRSSDGGLAQIRAPEGTLLSYATQPGNVALDGDDGHSPYTKALVDTMQKPGLDVFQTFNQVGLTVKRATGSSQQPWGLDVADRRFVLLLRYGQPARDGRSRPTTLCRLRRFLRLPRRRPGWRNRVSYFPIPTGERSRLMI